MEGRPFFDRGIGHCEYEQLLSHDASSVTGVHTTALTIIDHVGLASIGCLDLDRMHNNQILFTCHRMMFDHSR